MIIELGDNGLRSKYWWTAYDIPDTSNPIQAAYLAIRRICPFLTDNNHDWEAKDYGPCKEEHRRLKEYMQSSRYSFCYRVPGEEY